MRFIFQLIWRARSRCIVIPSEARNLTIAVAITPATLCDAAANARSFALLRMTTQHVSQLISRGKSSCSKSDVKRWHNPRTCTSAESSLSLAGLNFSSALGGMGWWRLEF